MDSTGSAAFSAVDSAILRSYAAMIDGLAAYLGEGCELVLYSLEDPQRSVVKIVNGHYTGRDTSAPISGIATSILNYLQTDNEQEYAYYTTHNKQGQQIKFVAIAVRGEGKRIIGMLCINSYQNMPQQEVLTDFFENPNALSCIPARDGMAGDSGAHAVADSIEANTLEVRAQVMQNASVSPALKNKEIVRQLNSRGIFQMKNAVVQVAELLGISKNTVYMHLRHDKNKKTGV